MAITLDAFSGTETVGTTEHSMTTDTAGPDADTTVGVFQAWIDFSAVAAGDEFEFAVYEKVNGSGTQRLAFKATIANAQAAAHYVSPSMVLGAGWDMTLKKTAGTDRALEWRIAQIA